MPSRTLLINVLHGACRIFWEQGDAASLGRLPVRVDADRAHEYERRLRGGRRPTHCAPHCTSRKLRGLAQGLKGFGGREVAKG